MPSLISKSNAEKAVGVVRDAGGEVVGKTRLQKMAYLLEITGLGAGFQFEYRHYGPYSEELADAIASAQFWDMASEDERVANWGGTYSVFKVASSDKSGEINPARKRLLSLAAAANPVSLELAATAAFLAHENWKDPWQETARRKPEKAEKYLEEAKLLYGKLRNVPTPDPLPKI